MRRSLISACLSACTSVTLTRLSLRETWTETETDGRWESRLSLVANTFGSPDGDIFIEESVQLGLFSQLSSAWFQKRGSAEGRDGPVG